MRMDFDKWARNAALGLVSGAAGTAFMTLSSTLETKIRGREKGNEPAEAAEKVLDIEPLSDKAETRLAKLVHWDYGTGWGLARSAMALAGLKGAAATLLHYVLIQGIAYYILPRFRLAPPPTQWGLRKILIDGMHHAIYATAAGMAYDTLSRALTPRSRPWFAPARMMHGSMAVTGLKKAARARWMPKASAWKMKAR